MPRNFINEIIPEMLYQRGQILTWQRAKKYQIFEDYGIEFVVNFWPKMDPDLAESPLSGYLHLPATQSKEMLSPEIEQAARLVASYCKKSPVLVLCEAGMTRSVYFCVLVASIVLDKSLEASRAYVTERVKRTALKGFMLARLLEEERTIENLVSAKRKSPRNSRRLGKHVG